VAGSWRFPALLPAGLQASAWTAAAAGLAGATRTTLVTGALASLMALALTVACLEHEARTGRRQRALALAYLPLLVPQVSFLFGLQVLFARLGLDATFPGLLWSHLVFVLPYLFLLLREPYLAVDRHTLAAAATLGSRSGRVWARVRLPLARRPLLVATAVGFSVSVAQYLPTVLIGAGRWPTLTTETLGLAAGGDRRLAAAASLLLALPPLVALAVALALPSPRLGRDRR
jgi:putative thiamine transport system permease protein